MLLCNINISNAYGHVCSPTGWNPEQVAVGSPQRCLQKQAVDPNPLEPKLKHKFTAITLPVWLWGAPRAHRGACHNKLPNKVKPNRVEP